MASLIPRAVALRKRSGNQKPIIKSTPQLETIDRPCLEQPQLSVDISESILPEASGPIKSVRIEVDAPVPTEVSSKKTAGLRHTAHFKIESPYLSKGNYPSQTDQQVYPKPIYKSSRTYAPVYYDQKRFKENSFPVGCIVWLTGLPECRLNKLQVIQLVYEILRIDETDNDILLGDSSSEKKNELVKYVDLQKGLDNCHIRFSNNTTSQKFLSCLNQFLESNSRSVSLEDDGDSCDFSRLKGTLLSGRREEIYWEKIPLHLYH